MMAVLIILLFLAMLYIGSIGEEASIKAAALCNKLRDEGFYVEYDTVGRSVKAQMKYADKIGAKMSCILGQTELETGVCEIKDMQTGQVQTIKFETDELTALLYEAGLQRATESMQQMFAQEEMAALEN